MVKAGVFLVAILLPAFKAANLLWIILIVGIASTLYGALNALTERHVKRILAYSTIEEMGLMFIALGLGSVYAAMLLFVVQTFYKALMFMLAGVAMKANEGEEDIGKMYGIRANRSATIALLIGAIALAGIFPFSGFFGKFAISGIASSLPIYIILIAIQVISSIYIFRWAALLLRRPKGQDRARIEIEYKTMSTGMIAAVLAAAAIVLISAVAYVYLPSYLGLSASTPSLLDAVAENIAAVAGIVLIYVTYWKGVLAVWKGRFKGAYLGVALNYFYHGFVRLAAGISFAAHGVESSLNWIVAHAVGVVSTAARLISRLESGKTNTYLVAFLVGIIIMIIIFVL